MGFELQDQQAISGLFAFLPSKEEGSQSACSRVGHSMMVR